MTSIFASGNIFPTRPEPLQSINIKLLLILSERLELRLIFSEPHIFFFHLLYHRLKDVHNYFLIRTTPEQKDVNSFKIPSLHKMRDTSGVYYDCEYIWHPMNKETAEVSDISKRYESSDKSKHLKETTLGVYQLSSVFFQTYSNKAWKLFNLSYCYSYDRLLMNYGVVYLENDIDRCLIALCGHHSNLPVFGLFTLVSICDDKIFLPGKIIRVIKQIIRKKATIFRSTQFFHSVLLRFFHSVSKLVRLIANQLKSIDSELYSFIRTVLFIA